MAENSQPYGFLSEKKKKKIPITMATAYDYPTACIEEEAGIDVILVGDSVGTNVLGYENERQVTMADMLHHLKAVVRGATKSLIMADMPYGSASDKEEALENSRVFINAGADIVKIEGWESKKEIVEFLTKQGIPVCGHIGYNPQYHGSKARIFGKDAAGARELVTSAKSLEQAGAVLLIVEKIPEEVAGLITTTLSIPVIGIGSGRLCDGQVLVFHDIVGLSSRTFRHAKAYANLRKEIFDAISDYIKEVEERTFPSKEHVSHLDPAILDELKNFPSENLG